MSHFNVPFVFGYVSSWFLQCIPSDQYPLNPSVWLHWGQRPTLLSFSTGEALILFPSQSIGLDIWVVIGADQLSPSESTASGPTALTFVQSEESMGPGGSLLSVERIQDCTPAQVRPRRLAPSAGQGRASWRPGLSLEGQALCGR